MGQVYETYMTEQVPQTHDLVSQRGVSLAAE